jgi:hypothetical protein
VLRGRSGPSRLRRSGPADPHRRHARRRCCGRSRRLADLGSGRPAGARPIRASRAAVDPEATRRQGHPRPGARSPISRLTPGRPG